MTEPLIKHIDHGLPDGPLQYCEFLTNGSHAIRLTAALTNLQIEKFQLHNSLMVEPDAGRDPGSNPITSHRVFTIYFSNTFLNVISQSPYPRDSFPQASHAKVLQPFTFLVRAMSGPSTDTLI
jgi:hypothetical protein